MMQNPKHGTAHTFKPYFSFCFFSLLRFSFAVRNVAHAYGTR